MPKRTTHSGVLAIDPGLRNTGWAYRTPGGFIHAGTIVTDPKESVFFRIGYVLEVLADKLKRAETVVIEDFLGQLGRTTVMLIGAIGGNAAAALANKAHKIPNRTWSTEFTGEKTRVEIKAKTMEKIRLLGHIPNSQHAADAIALLLWWEEKNGGPKRSAPERWAPGTYKRRPEGIVFTRTLAGKSVENHVRARRRRLRQQLRERLYPSKPTDDTSGGNEPSED